MLTTATNSESNDPELACPELVEGPSIVEGPQTPKPWYVYIAASLKEAYYTGISPNPMERLKKHNNGVGSKFCERPWRVKAGLYFATIYH
jgi:hypothetical protein